MSPSRKVAAVVVVLLGVAALLFGLRSCSTADDTNEPEAAPSASASPTPSLKPVRMSTTSIARSIKERLDANAGRPTRIECPERVAQKIGTTFECEVFFDDEPDTAAVATADVEIDGPDGSYRWTSTPKGQE